MYFKEQRISFREYKNFRTINTMRKRKYRSTDNSINGKIHEISSWMYTNTRKLEIFQRSLMSFSIRRYLFWSRKASVITEISQVFMCLCTFIWRSCHFSGEFSLFFVYLELENEKILRKIFWKETLLKSDDVDRVLRKLY